MAFYNQRNQENWISRLLDRKGQDYITSGKLTDVEVIRNIDRIIDDIINSRIDYNVYGNTLLHPVIFDNLLSYCRNRLSSEMTKLYSLNYTNWACETGAIVIGNCDHFVDNTFYDPSTIPLPYSYDASAWMNGHCTISQTTRNNIATSLRDVSIEYNKFAMLTKVLDGIQVSKNIYELQWASNNLKQYIRSNNKLSY